MKKFLNTMLLGIILAACNQNNVVGKNNNKVSKSEKTVEIKVPEVTGKYKNFRYSLEEMKDIASPSKLSWRIFYEKPSTGPNGEWFDAVKQGNLEKVKKMVEAGQDIEVKDTGSLNQTALGWAAFIGYEDMVDYLVEKGTDLEATDTGDVYNVLKSAVLGKNVKVVEKLHKLLIERGIKVDLNDQTVEDDNETLIMVAASNNRIEIVKYLLSQGADVNLVSKVKDQSALSFACDRGHKDMQKLLIENGAVNHRTGKAACN